MTSARKDFDDGTGAATMARKRTLRRPWRPETNREQFWQIADIIQGSNQGPLDVAAVMS
jgi:hypothetical protein